MRWAAVSRKAKAGPGAFRPNNVSKGLTRSRTDNSSSCAARAAGRCAQPRNNVTAMARMRIGPRRGRAEGAVALKQESQHDLSPTEKLEALNWSKAGAAAAAAPSKPNAG